MQRHGKTRRHIERPPGVEIKVRRTSASLLNPEHALSSHSGSARLLEGKGDAAGHWPVRNDDVRCSRVKARLCRTTTAVANSRAAGSHRSTSARGQRRPAVARTTTPRTRRTIRSRSAPATRQGTPSPRRPERPGRPLSRSTVSRATASPGTASPGTASQDTVSPATASQATVRLPTGSQDTAGLATRPTASPGTASRVMASPAGRLRRLGRRSRVGRLQQPATPASRVAVRPCPRLRGRRGARGRRGRRRRDRAEPHV